MILDKKRMIFLTLLLVGFFALGLRVGRCKKEVIIESKTNEKTVDNPRPIKEVDTVYIQGKKEIVYLEPKPSKKHLKIYKEAKTEEAKKEVFEEAVKFRDYEEKLEDENQIITVKSKVIGELKSQNISYVTKEQKVLSPRCKRRLLGMTAGIFASGINSDGIDPVFGVKADVRVNKAIYSVGIDQEKNVFLGIGITIF